MSDHLFSAQNKKQKKVRKGPEMTQKVIPCNESVCSNDILLLSDTQLIPIHASSKKQIPSKSGSIAAHFAFPPIFETSNAV